MANRKPDHPVLLVLDGDLHHRLLQVKRATGASASQIMREAIRAHLDRMEREHPDYFDRRHPSTTGRSAMGIREHIERERALLDTRASTEPPQVQPQQIVVELPTAPTAAPTEAPPPERSGFRDLAIFSAGAAVGAGGTLAVQAALAKAEEAEAAPEEPERVSAIDLLLGADILFEE